jgi:hypothetical protein
MTNFSRSKPHGFDRSSLTWFNHPYITHRDANILMSENLSNRESIATGFSQASFKCFPQIFQILQYQTADRQCENLFSLPADMIRSLLLTKTKSSGFLSLYNSARASLTSSFIGISRGLPFLVSRAVSMLRRKFGLIWSSVATWGTFSLVR